jgi:Domain of unknown function (DUF5665)
MKKSSKALGTVTFTLRTEKDFDKYVKYLSNPWHIMWRNFLSGTFHGVGFILGTAIFLTIFAFILDKVVGEIPFFSDFAKAINVWLEQNVHQ